MNYQKLNQKSIKKLITKEFNGENKTELIHLDKNLSLNKIIFILTDINEYINNSNQLVYNNDHILKELELKKQENEIKKLELELELKKEETKQKRIRIKNN